MQAPHRPLGEHILAQLSLDDKASIGKSIGELLAPCPTTTVLGLRRSTGELVIGPHREERLSAGDELIVLGPEAEIARVNAERRTSSAAPAPR
jgi:K+/H+ antiporter YhaU regulatory subunit KhtT